MCSRFPGCGSVLVPGMLNLRCIVRKVKAGGPVRDLGSIVKKLRLSAAGLVESNGLGTELEEDSAGTQPT